MEPQAPASFIPKKPLTPRPISTADGGGFLFLIASFLLLLSLVAAAGVFVYERYLDVSIASKDSLLQKDQTSFDFSTITQLVRLDSRINQSSRLLAQHVAPSAIFTLLSQETLQNIQLTAFSYALQSDGSATITLSGIADTFSTLALQSDQFSSSGALKNVIFKDINTDPNGHVIFTVDATVNPAFLLYSNAITTTAQAQTQPLTTTTASSSASTTSVQTTP